MIQRTDVLFLSGEVHCAAWLYQPERQEPHPVIIMAHGLGGTREMRLDAYAEKFCRAGYACLVFDYRHFGASEGQPRQLLDIAHQLQDWRSAVAYARTLDSLDATRVILWGSSFSGGHVLEVAAPDSPFAPAMVQGPFTDGPAARQGHGHLEPAQGGRAGAGRYGRFHVRRRTGYGQAGWTQAFGSAFDRSRCRTWLPRPEAGTLFLSEPGGGTHSTVGSALLARQANRKNSVPNALLHMPDR